MNWYDQIRKIDHDEHGISFVEKSYDTYAGVDFYLGGCVCESTTVYPVPIHTLIRNFAEHLSAHGWSLLSVQDELISVIPELKDWYDGMV